MLHSVATREQIIKYGRNINKNTNRIDYLNNKKEHENVDLMSIVKLLQLILINEESE